MERVYSSMTIIHPITTMQDIDTRLLIAREVRFTKNSVLLPNGTCWWPEKLGTGFCSTSTRDNGAIEVQQCETRYLLPCRLEISYIIKTERDLRTEVLLLEEKTVTIPLEPIFIWENVLNTDPAFKEEYNAILCSSLTGNWHNEEMNALDAEEN